ncbi:MAG: MarR family transcriptional regulator [Kordiimonas sp.]|nr:MarR family transcriptional regulator [Kordiimonas sp.]|tara:strand:- start:1110 stop:1625 length:516 start_codon:yes stop_codon:yes gene_type:complete
MSFAQNSSLIGANETPEAQTRLKFLDCLRLVERLHRRMLDILKIKLDQTGLSDINSVQALLLYNIGDHEMTAGELRSRGYYLGSNVSYNLKKLVEYGYILQERSEHDRRSVRIRLSDKGREVCQLVQGLFDDHLAHITSGGHLESEEIAELQSGLKNLERFWSEQIGFSTL